MKPNNFRSLSESARKVLNREYTCSPTKEQLQSLITEQGTTMPGEAAIQSIMSNWGNNNCGGPWCGDFNGDGVVDVQDLLWVIDNWGDFGPQGAQAPAPTLTTQRPSQRPTTGGVMRPPSQRPQRSNFGIRKT